MLVLENKDNKACRHVRKMKRTKAHRDHKEDIRRRRLTLRKTKNMHYTLLMLGVMVFNMIRAIE